MVIYPDTSDFIDLCRGRGCITRADLVERLRDTQHRIVFSMDTVLEVASPLKEGRTLEVRRDLNQLEELPHIFVNEARIRYMEIREAIAAFQQRRD
jgi:hypothetical protein